MRILILGGTVFLSRRIAVMAVESGHNVTCLARGTSSAPPDGVAFIQADRDQPHAYGLAGEWDAVVDVSSDPRQVREALTALGGRARHWTFVSSCSVYADNGTPGQDERAQLLPAYDGGGPASAEQYGEAKVACEEACADALGDRLLIARPGLICGPGDGSDRFGYWPARLAQGGEVLAPEIRDAHTQTIDVDDLALWIVQCAENLVTGTYNALGPSIPFGELLDATVKVAGFDGGIGWAPPAWLTDCGVAYWAGPDSLPHWLPDGYEGFAARSSAAARVNGLALRPVEETIARVLEDERRRGLTRGRKSGLLPETEEKLLAELAG
ncbi:NAD-dependent epimerase/dehydratase family protein, partial [Arthrobacter sp. H5]|uniref:NAD-dependent epimerase/dehydratase family protein n=1 Tax=Arthrobacter sp. H5 TaxID=1267973 RepID=UPI000489CBF6